MVTTALYHWKVSGSPVNILIDLSVIDRFRVAAASSDSEIGGLLLGHFDGNFTVINDFDLVECEHRRGAAYTLSQRDDQRLSARIETRRKRGATVVGFFRSHLRPGLFLDEGDNSALTSHFNNPSQVALLIRPAADRTATGGFFFWEDGEMNRKQTYLPFPMNARELEMGDYPLVEPVSAAGTAPATPATAPPPPTPDFNNAETLDSVARPAPLPVEETEPTSRTVLPEPRRLSHPRAGTDCVPRVAAKDSVDRHRSHRRRCGIRRLPDRHLRRSPRSLRSPLRRYDGQLLAGTPTHRPAGLSAPCFRKHPVRPRAIC